MGPSNRITAVQTPIIPVVAELIEANPGTISLGQGVVNYGPPPQAFDPPRPSGRSSARMAMALAWYCGWGR